MKQTTALLSSTLILLFLTIGCSKQAKQYPVSINRFDKATVQWIRSEFDDSLIESYVNDTSDYFNIYCKGVWGFEGDMKNLWLDRLNATFRNEHLQKLCFDTEQKFPDIRSLETEIGRGLYQLQQGLPYLILPRTIYTHISGLQQSIIIASDFISIALDKYLGSDYPMYKPYFYEYQRKTMSSEYIPRDIFRLLLLDAYPNMGGALLDRMIYEGKIIYALSQIIPDTPKEMLFGYTLEQMEWCKRNEKTMWHYLISEELLYSEDINVLNKLLGEAGFTNDFGEESPDKAVSWIGYQIVKLYIEKESDDLNDLFQAKPRTVLQTSKFKY